MRRPDVNERPSGKELKEKIRAIVEAATGKTAKRDLARILELMEKA